MPCEKQSIRLQSLPKSRYQHFIALYAQVKEEGLESHTFNQLFKALYESEVIFPFDWMDWQPARDAWNNPDYNFDQASLLELSQHLTAIFRADRFQEGTIVTAFNNGMFEKIFNSLQQKAEALQN